MAKKNKKNKKVKKEIKMQTTQETIGTVEEIVEDVTQVSYEDDISQVPCKPEEEIVEETQPILEVVEKVKKERKPYTKKEPKEKKAKEPKVKKTKEPKVTTHIEIKDKPVKIKKEKKEFKGYGLYNEQGALVTTSQSVEDLMGIIRNSKQFGYKIVKH